jgi:hypothetical protein
MTDPMLPSTIIDVSQLDTAAEVLGETAKFVERYCLAEMPAILTALGSPTNVADENGAYSFVRRATFFGGFYSAFGIQERHDSAYRDMEQILKLLITQLNQAADATRVIAQNFRTVEERNLAMAADIERALLGYGLIPPGGGSQ